MLRIFSTSVVDPEEEHRGPGPSSVFRKAKIPHTHLITRGKTAWNVNLMIHVVDTCIAIAYWMILLLLSPDKDQSSVIFGSGKGQ